MIGSLIGGALAVGSQIYGGVKASQAMKQAKSSIEQQQKENQAWYDRRYNEDATQRADAQRILQITQQNIKDRNKAAQGAAAVMGGTEESVAATKAANAQAMADAAGQIAASGAARKDAVEGQYMAQKQGLQQQLNNMELQRAQNVAQAAGQAAGAAGTAGLAADESDLAQRIDQRLFKKAYEEGK